MKIISITAIALLALAWMSGAVAQAYPTKPVRMVVAVPEGSARVQSNDVTVDERGLIYLLDRVRGLHMLERS